ncbi:restriction endonuclease subunit S [Bizionia paragorgiae]|uniref:Type I restriction enzyme, S subunit n=1 Tax=Bizionia paragorgiae TaxID=283786 RepID=A0A1H3X0V1_BIZPA|nr:restriction endonuclease subunit S [Bizionia paragorgiae]SDZ93029.1 type I restriction enzyme, S subunit [Bizionia paragorgiae]
MKRYKSYKTTNISWYPEVPSEWKVCKVKHIANTYAGGTPSTIKSEYWDNGEIPWLPSGKLQNGEITTAEKFITVEGLKNSSTKWIKESTVLIALTGATCANIGFLNFEACANQSVVAIDEFKDRANSRFLYYMFLMMRKQILTHQTGGAQAGINDGNVKNLYLNLPSLKEQTQIAKYLDHKTQIIDALIEKKEQLIKKLQAQRQAIINEAVTKGLNPNTKMKDSGIEWLGWIPEHWEAKRLKYIFNIQKRIAGELGYDILSVTQRGLKVKDISNYKGQFSMDYSKYQIVYEGDFVMNHMDLLTGYVDISKQIGVTSPDYRVFELIEKKCNQQYFLYICQLCYKERIFYSHGQGVSQLGRWRLQAKEFNNMTFPFPSFEEQTEIADFINKKTKIMDRILVETEKSIKKLKSYRQSIISEAVTGKIDVRDWQPNEF